MQNTVHKLINPDKVYSRIEVLGNPCPVPKQSGIYAWFFREIPSNVPVDTCITWNGLTLLYGGISPSAPSKKTGKVSSQNLYKRIRTHLDGNAYGSTLRRTLGCLLSNQLDLHPQLTPNRKGFTFGVGETLLSEWMEKNAFVTWQVHETPWEVEKVFIHSISLPLNLQDNVGHPFYKELKAIRKKCKALAL